MAIAHPTAENLIAEQNRRAAWKKTRLSANAERKTPHQLTGDGQRMTDLADVSDEQVASIWEGITAIATVLREAGYPKPKD